MVMQIQCRQAVLLHELKGPGHLWDNQILFYCCVGHDQHNVVISCVQSVFLDILVFQYATTGHMMHFASYDA